MKGFGKSFGVKKNGVNSESKKAYANEKVHPLKGFVIWQRKKMAG